MIRLQAFHRRGGSPKGFTLFEMLIAVGLCTLLMMAVYAALQIYFDLQLDSHEEVTRQQVARALLRSMTRDIQSTVFVKRTVVEESGGASGASSASSASSMSGGSSTAGEASGSASTGGSTSTGTSSGTNGTPGSTTGTSSTGSSSFSSSASQLDGNSYGDATIDPATALANSTSGIIGTSNDLQLFVSKPDPGLGYSDSQSITSVSSRSSDLILIRYLMAETGGGGLSSSLADKFGAADQVGAVGLARMEGDLFGLTTAVDDVEEIPLVSASELVAEEVSEVRFRYFDGLQWQDEWNSTTLNQMPKAIEVVLTLRKEASSSGEEEAKPDDLPESTHRMVIPVPVATPFIVEDQL
ncbi:MAG: type II secretion system protein GspJ [Planctomycetota bacterium]